jgi:hypothetical protein
MPGMAAVISDPASRTRSLSKRFSVCWYCDNDVHESKPVTSSPAIRVTMLDE